METFSGETTLLFQCLKCSAKFQKAKTETSFALCPHCNSSIVIQQYTDQEARMENSTKIEDELPIENQNTQTSKVGLQDSNYLPRGDSSFEVLAHVGDSTLNSVNISVGGSQSLLAEEKEEFSGSRISSPSPLLEANNIVTQVDSMG